jgi:hypothetical protein
MKKTILGLAILLALVSCKTTKNANCDAYGSNKKSPLDFDYVMIDTLYLEEEHVHLEEECLCSWLPAQTYIIVDTLKIRVCIE